jgi:hypothetical protein
MRERLRIALRLQFGTAVHEVPGGNVRKLALSMTAYGVEGTIEFVLQDDAKRGGTYRDRLLADFVEPDLAKIEVSIQAVQADTGVPLAKGEIVTGGIVVERQVEEHVYSRVVDAPAVLARRYRVTFRDPAAALWRQHFPCELSTKKSFADVIKAHQGSVSVTFDWDVITKVVPLVFFHLDPDRGASFYDLVVWYLRGREGVLTFDHRLKTYAIKGTKDAKSAPVEFVSGDLARVRSWFAEVPRHVPRIKNSYTEAANMTTLANPDAASGVFHDVVLRTSIAGRVTDRAALEKSRPLAPARELFVSFGRFPTEAPTPNAVFELSAVEGGPLSKPAEFRVIELDLAATALDDDVETNYGEPATRFELSVDARLEAKQDRRVRLPAFTPPQFPGLLEGKVVSEVGAKDELTYQLYPDAATSVDHYQVRIPLFQDQIVTAPYDTYSGAGSLYLPLYKGERVLMAFEFDRARVRELLDWRGEARVPPAGQGQHLFLGKTAKNSTSVLHDYQAEKPVFRILRTNQSDTSFFKLEEGRLTLRVEEKAGA